MERPNDNLIARLEQSLRESRSGRMQLSARLREIEAEADQIRSELAEIDHLASQTQAAIYRLVSSVLAANNLSPGFSGLPSDAELEAAMRQATPQPRVQTRVEVSYQPSPAPEVRQQPAPPVELPRQPVYPVAGRRQYADDVETRRQYGPPPDVRRQPIPIVRNNIEALSDRFIDRTIPQAVTLLLREEGAPLHVNEIYNRLLEGGFKFTGANPTISIAVSLNRNGRFRKMAPGTFDLMMRDASKAS